MTSFAKSISPSTIKAAPARDSFEAASHGSHEQKPSRASAMVAKDKPHPAPRPSPGMAGSADRQAFNAAWKREGKDAAAHQREARKAAFKEKRRETHAVPRARSFNRAAGR